MLQMSTTRAPDLGAPREGGARTSNRRAMKFKHTLMLSTDCVTSQARREKLLLKGQRTWTRPSSGILLYVAP